MHTGMHTRASHKSMHTQHTPCIFNVLHYCNYVIQGRRNVFKSGGAKIILTDYKMHAHFVQSTHAGMRSMPNLGGSGGMPPQKILKIYTL